jgi:hypothetical protein
MGDARLGRQLESGIKAEQVERLGPLQPYDRSKVLPRLLPVTRRELTDNNPETLACLRRKIASALRRERALGRAGHWTYDLTRHAALLQAQRAEAARPR